MIHLEQERLESLIYHHIKPEYMKAHVPRVFFRLAMPILMVDRWHPR